MKNIIIHHPQGECTLEEIQADVVASRTKFNSTDFSFTALTVQALIDKINEQALLLEEAMTTIKLADQWFGDYSNNFAY